MLRVIEYFAKSLKVIQNDTVQKGVSVCISIAPFLRYSALNNGVRRTLKCGFEVAQGH